MSGTIKELGPSILSIGAVWIPLVFIRTIVRKTIVGGGAAVWTALLKQFVLVEKIATEGIALNLDGGTVIVYLRIGNFVLDGDAVRMMFGPKGGRPKMPCVGCLNVVTDSALVRDDNGLVPSTCNDVSAFAMTTHEDHLKTKG